MSDRLAAAVAELVDAFAKSWTLRPSRGRTGSIPLRTRPAARRRAEASYTPSSPRADFAVSEIGDRRLVSSGDAIADYIAPRNRPPEPGK